MLKKSISVKFRELTDICNTNQYFEVEKLYAIVIYVRSLPDADQEAELGWDSGLKLMLEMTSSQRHL